MSTYRLIQAVSLIVILTVILTGCTSLPATTATPLKPSETVEVEPQQTASVVLPSPSATKPEASATPANKPVQETRPTASASPTAAASDTPEPTATEPLAPGSYFRTGNPIVVDHTSVALFEQIPPEYLAAARKLGVMFADRSVGANIDEGLDCLTASSWASAPAHCRTDYIGSSWNFQTYTSDAPARISFDPDPLKYDRSNWVFEMHSGEWWKLTEDFITNLAPKHIDTADVLSYQITYLNVDEHSDIMDPNRGFFVDNPDRYDIYDLEAYMSQHPDKVFPIWTTSLARAIGTQASTDFNAKLRQYAKERNLVLFDVADIEAHTDQGSPCFDNRDGVEYCSQNGKCENYPDDGMDFLAICQDYTTETDGGHLGSVSGGKIMIAKAFWVMMAQIAGWTPNP